MSANLFFLLPSSKTKAEKLSQRERGGSPPQGIFHPHLTPPTFYNIDKVGRIVPGFNNCPREGRESPSWNFHPHLNLTLQIYILYNTDKV
jgi:hypothetical protein